MLLNHNDGEPYISFDNNYYKIVSSLHEVVKKFLLYNAMLSSSALVEHLLVVVKTDWLTKHSTVDCCSLVNQAC